MTPAQEDFALRSCHPLYREWCKEDPIDSEHESDREIDEGYYADLERECREEDCYGD